jgi:hypothetical protein
MGDSAGVKVRKLRQKTMCFDMDRLWSHSRNPSCQNVSHRPECSFMLQWRIGYVWLAENSLPASRVTFFGLCHDRGCFIQVFRRKTTLHQIYNVKSSNDKWSTKSEDLHLSGIQLQCNAKSQNNMNQKKSMSAKNHLYSQFQGMINQESDEMYVSPNTEVHPLNKNGTARHKDQHLHHQTQLHLSQHQQTWNSSLNGILSPKSKSNSLTQAR